jgi:hypothetical protein
MVILNKKATDPKRIFVELIYRLVEEVTRPITALL